LPAFAETKALPKLFESRHGGRDVDRASHRFPILFDAVDRFQGHCSRQGWCDGSNQGSGHAALEATGLARIANAQLFYNRYKNRDRNEKEGQPNSVGLLISALLSDWCGGGDLNPYALRR
jgi:hypothetical protein